MKSPLPTSPRRGGIEGEGDVGSLDDLVSQVVAPFVGGVQQELAVGVGC